MNNLRDQLLHAIEEMDEVEKIELFSFDALKVICNDERGSDQPLQIVARSDGQTALHIARALLNAGADINFQGDDGCTALHRSIQPNGNVGRCNWAMARFLMSEGSDPSLCDHDGMIPAEIANSNGNNDAVLALLDAGMDPTTGGKCGPLIWYMSYGSPDVVSKLLSLGADPNAMSYSVTSPPQTPLQRAAEAFHSGCSDEKTFFETAMLLIQAGADMSQLEPLPLGLESMLLARKEASIFADLLSSDKR